MNTNQQSSINNHQSTLRGYVALTSVLVVAAIMVVIIITVSLVSISEGQMSYAEYKKEETIDIVEACTEEALYRLKRTEVVQEQFPLLEATCSATINSQSGDDWDFTVTASTSGYLKKIRIDATSSNTITINSWQEVE
jgi:hypothetical protein